MSKNSHKQTYESFMEWLKWMKIKPKKKLINNISGNTIGDYINK